MFIVPTRLKRLTLCSKQNGSSSRYVDIHFTECNGCSASELVIKPEAGLCLISAVFLFLDVFTPSFVELTSSDYRENLQTLRLAGVDFPFGECIFALMPVWNCSLFIGVLAYSVLVSLLVNGFIFAASCLTTVIKFCLDLFS